MENKIRKENTTESNPFWNCVCARVRATGKYIKVLNSFSQGYRLFERFLKAE